MAKHKFVHPQRDNAGIPLPEFVIHAALSSLPEQLGSGHYGRGSLEEPIVKVVQGMSQSLIDSVFENLRRKPPSVGLEFPNDPQQLPAIFVTTETMTAAYPVLADDVGTVAPEVNEYTDEHVLIQTAVGGETQCVIPVAGDLITDMVELVQTVAGADIELIANEDFTVDAASKTVTLIVPLGLGDTLTCTRRGAWGLPGGDLYGNTFSGTYVVFIDTDNPVVTSVLKAIVWRELTLQTSRMLASGLVDLGYTIRYQSIWQDIKPALGHRAELVVNCLTTWIAYARVPTIKTVEADIRHNATQYDANDTDVVLEMSIPLVRWQTDEEAEQAIRDGIDEE